MKGSALRHVHRVLDQYEPTPDNQPSALDWLAQQRREAAEAERKANTDTVRAMGPHFCDFFFGGPGEAEYLQQQLAAACREAAAEELEGWADERELSIFARLPWTKEEFIQALRDRAAALRARKEVGE
jgi:hypothetical protein